MLQRNNNVNCITQVQPCNQLSQNLEVLLEDNKTIITVWVKISLILVVTYHSNNIGTLYCRLFTKQFSNENKIFMVNIKCDCCYYPFLILQFILGLHEVPIPDYGIIFLTMVDITVLNTHDNKSTVPLYYWRFTHQSNIHLPFESVTVFQG